MILTTTDTFVITLNTLRLKNMELGKIMDLHINAEVITTGEGKEFNIDDAKTSEEEMCFEIIDWGIPTDEPPTFLRVTKGDTKILVTTGKSGEEIEKDFEKASEKERSNLWFWILIFSMLIVVLGLCYQRIISIPKVWYKIKFQPTITFSGMRGGNHLKCS